MTSSASAADTCSRSSSTDASCSMASSWSSQPRKAVMLKGPSLTSKTYFVPLPGTLDQLVAKAVQLFPIPPGKVPHITLGTDERAIILQESYDFIRDRELLHFRWSAETPRRNLANRVRWDQAAASASTAPFPITTTASPQVSSPESPVPASVASAAEALKAQVQTSPSSKRDLTSTTRANTIANRDPNAQFGEGATARKAHVQRVLAEQQRKREEEHVADALGSAPIIAEVEPDAVVDNDPEATEKAALELAASSTDTEVTSTSGVQKISEEVPAASLQDSDMTMDEDMDSRTETAITSQVSDDVLSPTVVAAPEAEASPAAVAITIESPPRKKHTDNGGLDTPPSSGSRSSSPFHSSDRASNSARALDHRMLAEADDEPSSSPMSSPTRDISSRYRNIVSSVPPMPQLSIAPTIVPAEVKDPTQQAPNAVDSASAVLSETENGSITSEVVAEVSSKDAASSEVNATLSESAASKPISNPANDRELNRIYSFLSNLVSQLLSHKANWAFQRPMSVEFEQFSTRSSRPVDLFTIRDSLASRKYGSQHLEGRMAANAVITDFEDDLTMLYTNARRFFGIRSTQAECVEHLEKFSRSFLNEWKRTQGSVAQKGVPAPSPSDAMARLSAFRSPDSRSEKRPGLLSSSPSPMLLAPEASTANGSAPGSSGKTVGINGQAALPNAMGLMRRPDFTFKRNTSYESSLPAVKRPAQPNRATSEAFEKALRAATATPQAERVKPRQEVVAPFATRSVIETDFMARPAPQQQPDVPSTPSSTNKIAQTPTAAGNKRKAGEAAGTGVEDQAVLSRSPSLSPPPSPSPTKRNRQVASVKPSKSATHRSNKKARQVAAAAAAAAAAVAAVKPTEKKRGKKVSSDADEEQHVLDLLDAEPVSKRAHSTRGSSRDVDSQRSTPEAEGNSSKGKKSKTAPARTCETTLNLPLIPATPSARLLRPRRTSISNNEPLALVSPPKTPPRSAKKANARSAVSEALTMDDNDFGVQSMDIDGFEVTGSRRKSSRQRKHVNLD
ncbi:hypothetical protein NDA10_002854 [Ustilago hordei]|uniref:Bromo domain-containing protein n=1 Tax=Ustilago hordei TaxID=120017 RepID=I2G3C9_USTHO|nr:uncharacterized protein UHO2_02926 [Ustilago hordei]KAJ1038226.1 hypothetical protein NDA10_002854 [Ustilago hordei]UTT94339.1 hypothetical protein NDA17_001443 [Ustilago hordei]CCF53672.1 uncharacterized protein UHOR_02263 [Ustilago hordei]SYW78914.1 uncharacterized protein UHO2_02926 [Ustilago hordei]